MSVKGSTWLDNAITAYYRSRIQHILSQVETLPPQVLFQQWEALLIDMHGDEQDPKNDIFNVILNDDKISEAAKNWLKEYIRGSQHAK